MVHGKRFHPIPEIEREKDKREKEAVGSRCLKVTFVLPQLLFVLYHMNSSMLAGVTAKNGFLLFVSILSVSGTWPRICRSEPAVLRAFLSQRYVRCPVR